MNKVILAVGIGLLLFSKQLFGNSDPGTGSSTGSNLIDANGNYIGSTIPYQGGPYTDSQLQMAFDTLNNNPAYSKKLLNDIERLYRLETGHFKSGQFAASFSPGMVAVNNSTTFPFGWSSLQTWANANGLGPSDFGTTGVYNTSVGPKRYVSFNGITNALKFTAWFIKNARNGDAAKWYTSNANSSDYQNYRNYLNNMRLRYTI